MLSRRCRIQARPNIKPTVAVTKVSKNAATPVEASNKHASLSSGTVPFLNKQLTPSDVCIVREPPCEKVIEREAEMNVEESFCQQTILASKNKTVVGASEVFCNSVGDVKGVQKNASFNGSEPSSTCVSKPVQHNSNCMPAAPQHSVSVLRSPELPRRFRRRFTGEEPLDPRKMTMQDLITWNPKNDTIMKYHIDKRSRKCSTGISASELPLDNNSVKNEDSMPSLPAPKVRVAEDGTLVLDESSLTVAQERPANIWETVDEDRVVRKISSLSFRKSALRKGSPWTDLETELFYLILRATGPDFGLMHEFFPSRSRNELKSKFNREERTNWDRLKHSLSTPTLLDNSLYDEAERLLRKIKDEAVRKKEKNQQSRKRQNLSDRASVDWNEEDADLVAEAEEEIIRIQNAGGTQLNEMPLKKPRRSTRVAKRVKEKIMEETSNEAKKMILDKKRRRYDAEAKMLHNPAVDGLSSGFPNFKLVYDDCATAATITLDDEDVPVVKVPKGTVARVLQQDDTQPERVLFECPENSSFPARRYIIKYQAGPGEQSSGFLHLFGAIS